MAINSTGKVDQSTIRFNQEPEAIKPKIDESTNGTIFIDENDDGNPEYSQSIFAITCSQGGDTSKCGNGIRIAEDENSDGYNEYEEEVLYQNNGDVVRTIYIDEDSDGEIDRVQKTTTYADGRSEVTDSYDSDGDGTQDTILKKQFDENGDMTYYQVQQDTNCDGNLEHYEEYGNLFSSNANIEQESESTVEQADMEASQNAIEEAALQDSQNSSGGSVSSQSNENNSRYKQKPLIE